VEDCHGCSLDLSAFTIEELDNITSEYTLKNTVGLYSYYCFIKTINVFVFEETVQYFAIY